MEGLGDADVGRELGVRGDDGEVRKVLSDVVLGAAVEVLGEDEKEVWEVGADGVAVGRGLGDLGRRRSTWGSR